MNNHSDPLQLAYRSFDEKRMASVDFYIEAQTRTPSFYMPYEHTHSVLEFYYLRTGHCLYIINGAYVRLDAGDIVLVAPGVHHSTSYTGTTPSERIAVYINTDALPPHLADQVPELFRMLQTSDKRITDKTGRPIIEELLRRIAKEQFSPSPSSNVLLSLYVSELLIQTLNHSTRAKDLFISMKDMQSDIEQALQIIDTRFSQPLSLDTIASELKLNPVYFSHKFKTTTGHTFKEYLNNVRIRNATHQLLVSDDTITKVALDSGFSSSNYFKDLFRKYMGCSPREYRKQATVSSKFGSGTAQ